MLYFPVVYIMYLLPSLGFGTVRTVTTESQETNSESLIRDSKY